MLKSIKLTSYSNINRSYSENCFYKIQSKKYLFSVTLTFSFKCKIYLIVIHHDCQFSNSINGVTYYYFSNNT